MDSEDGLFAASATSSEFSRALWQFCTDEPAVAIDAFLTAVRSIVRGRKAVILGPRIGIEKSAYRLQSPSQILLGAWSVQRAASTLEILLDGGPGWTDI
jgi:hypothetical protein